MITFSKKFLNKLICFFSAMLICFTLIPDIKSSAITFTPDFTINSESAILYNIDADMVVYEKNPDLEQMPAQLVDIMTALIVLENCTDITATTITANSALYAEFNVYSYPVDIQYADILNGDVLTVKDLLYAMMLASSAEAANILANQFGGNDIHTFVGMMNDKAKELGMEHTTFINANGLFSAAQMTTANDMLVLMKYALKNAVFMEIATAQSYTPSNPNTQNGHDASWSWTHSNTMSNQSSEYYYEGASGIKTGNLMVWGRNLIAKATSEGNNYLVILMRAPYYDETGESRFYHLEDAKALFDWAFQHFSYQTIVSNTTEKGEVQVNFGDKKDYVLLLPDKEFDTLWCDSVNINSMQQIATIDENVTAPINKGDVLGKLELKLSGETVATIDLVSSDTVKRSSYKYNLAAIKQFVHSEWFKKGMIIASILSGVYISIWLYFKTSTSKETPIRSFYDTKHGKKK